MARDLNLTLEPADWAHIWQATNVASPNIVALETNYKVFTGWYLIPDSISKCLPLYPQIAFEAIVHLVHMFTFGGNAPQ